MCAQVKSRDVEVKRDHKKVVDGTKYDRLRQRMVQEHLERASSKRTHCVEIGMKVGWLARLAVCATTRNESKQAH